MPTKRGPWHLSLQVGSGTSIGELGCRKLAASPFRLPVGWADVASLLDQGGEFLAKLLGLDGGPGLASRPVSSTVVAAWRWTIRHALGSASG
jgi:hypothetical protein